MRRYAGSRLARFLLYTPLMLPAPSRLSSGGVFADAGRLSGRRRRVAVMLNAHAKRVTPRVVDGFRRSHGRQHVYFAESVEVARVHARTVLEAGYDAVLVGGGDGTLTTVLNLLIEEAQPHRRAARLFPDIGVLRLGTGNGVATLVGAGRPLSDARQASDADAMPLRLVEDGESGRVFPFGSVGYDAQVLNDYVDMLAARRGLSRVVAKSLAGYFFAIGTRTIPAEMRGRRPKLRLKARGRASILDPESGEEIPLGADSVLFEGSARAVIVGTTPYYGYGIRVLPSAMRRRDRFQVRVSAASIPYLLSHLPQLWKGRLSAPEVTDFLCEGLDVESSLPLPAQLAGDGVGYRKRWSLSLSPHVFRLLTPGGDGQTARA